MSSTRDFLPEATKAPDAMSPLSKTHKKRADLFTRYWAYYRGHHRKNIKAKPNQADDNVTINWSKKIVNASVAFLFGKPLSFIIDDDDTVSKAEQYLADIWASDPARNWSPMTFLQSVAMNGGVTGTPFVRLYVEDDVPRMVNLNPSLVDVITNPDDIADIWEYHISWSYKNKRGEHEWKRHKISRDGDIWLIEEQEYNRGKWVTDEEESEQWPYPFAPVFYCQNLINPNSIWGISDLEDADMNDAINFVASNTNRIVRFHAHPRTIGTGFAANQLQTTAVDQFWAIPADGAKVFNLEMDSDLASSRQHKTDLEEAYHQVSSTPRFDPTSLRAGVLSGFAIQLLYLPLVQKTDKKRETYGGMLQRLNYALLVIGGYEPATVRNVWKSPLPSDDNEKAARFEKLVNTGQVDAYAAAIVAGYDKKTAQLLAESDTLEPLAP